MANLYKVWARGCIRPKGMRIERVWKRDLEDAFVSLMDEAYERKKINYLDDNGEVDEAKYNEYYSKVAKHFSVTKCIERGDYQIIEVDDDFDASDIHIPNCCGSDLSIFDSIECEV